VLSFDALRDLAVAVGMLPDRAWLWPVAIDVSIANSTVALLSLAPPQTLRGTGTTGARSAPAAYRAVSRSPNPSTARPGSPGESPPRALVAVPQSVGPAVAARWETIAEELVRSGVTSKEPHLVASVLAEHAAGTPRSTIGRRLAIHHQTVGRILAGADELAG
jgi:hypothetical protein